MDKEEKKNLYEGMFVISTTLSDEARKKALERVVSNITERGGVLHKTHEWGRKKLAYEIRGRREGYYYILYFEVRPSAITELWREFHLNEDLIRFITLRTDKVEEEVQFEPLVKQ